MAAKVFIIAGNALPMDEIWKFIADIGLPRRTEIEPVITSPHGDVFSALYQECQEERPQFILDLSHDLEWTCWFLWCKDRLDFARDIPILHEADTARLMIKEMFDSSDFCEKPQRQRSIEKLTRRIGMD